MEATHKRERRKDARPAELLAAALDLFVEKGFAATRVEEVAQQAGVSKGTVFLYFPTKEALFKAVVREHISGRFSEWNEEFDRFTGDTSAMVRHSMHEWWRRVGATKASGITKLVMGEAGTFPEIADIYRQEVIEPGNQLIRRILQRGIERGEFKKVPLEHAIYSVIAPMIFLVTWRHALGPCGQAIPNLDPVAFLETQADILLQGLCSPSVQSEDPQQIPTGVSG
jgi:TetR/AcrR family transcriptional regulator